MTTDAASSQESRMFDFLFTSRDGLSVVAVVSGERFLAGDDNDD